MFARLTPDLHRDVCQYLPLTVQATLFARGAPNVSWHRKWFVWRSFRRIVGPREPRQPFVFDTANECVWAMAFLSWAEYYMWWSFPLARVRNEAVQQTGLIMTRQGGVFNVCRRVWTKWWRTGMHHGPDENWWSVLELAPAHRLEAMHRLCHGEPLRDHLNEYREHFLHYFLEVVGIPCPRGMADSWHGVNARLLDIVRRAER